MKKGKIGAVMVVGGGIGGIQAALDLADSGYKVYLVEKKSAIGGVMSQLDKTFPTNDCSMCIMGPKLVECGRHLNIEILTLSDIEGITGEEGNFSVRVYQTSRYIDPDKCTGCGDCASVCPVNLPDEYNQGLGMRAATYLAYPQGVPRVYCIEKKDRAPCRLACPAGLNVQGYVQMVKVGKYKEALQIIMEDLPLPGVLGRICPHGCEDACRRCEVDEAVAIRDLKRLASDQFDPREIEIECLPPREEKTAIIGSGPAGLSAAYHLARKGVLSTIFEALPEPGGMLRVGIPPHRLPRKVLDQEIEIITNLGVEIRTNTPLGPKLTVDGLFKRGYKAVYLAIGAHKGIELGIPGEDASGVRQGIDFLREVNLTGKADVGKRLAIIGGGNVAIDVARSSLRLGAQEVNIVYRRTRAEMPAWEEEIQAAEAEGAKITYLSAPQEVLTENGKVVGLRCIRMELGEPDSSGRRRPIPIPGSEYDIEIDQLIPAIGQIPDISTLQGVSGLDFSRWGTIEVDPITFATGREGLFAGGDLQTGPWVAIGAIAAGREAAESILRYLDGRDMAEGREPVTKENPLYRPIPEDESTRARARMPDLPVEDRKGNFDEVELGYDEETGRREADRCLNCGYCCECFQCIEACKAQAINHDMTDKVLDINVGSIILAPGFQPYDPGMHDTYQYARFPNVVTSLEFERILSASGPYEGHLVRPSDHKEPEKIAWIQCVGSRNVHIGDKGYCSSVCCTYAIKQAMIAKEHSDNHLDTNIFFIDIRTHGKDFEKFFNRARDEMGVRFLKSRIHNILPGDNEGNLKIRYTDETGKMIQEEYNMVVLSVGLDISQESMDLARKLGIELNHYNFASTKSFDPIQTTKQGIFVCGVFQGPKDIPETVMQASGAAAAASSLLSSERHTLTKEPEYPEEIDVTGQEPRIGVFVCNCGINIGGVVDVPDVTKYVSTLPYVVVAEENLFSCSEDSQVKIKEMINEYKLTRVVVASCSPRTHEPLFQDTIREAGLNPYLFGMANIRDQDSWVHQSDKESATEKAKDLVRMAVANATKLSPLYRTKLPVTKRILIIGGGIAGMTAALNIAEQGFEVVLAEREKELGGFARNIHKTLQGDNVQEYLTLLIERINRNEKIEVLTETILADFSGIKGNFKTALNVGLSKDYREVDHGAVIIATGAVEYRPEEYLYGEHDSVKTQVELEDILLKEEKRIKEWKNVVMIQCVGSRNEAHPNCSRLCCNQAIKNAITLKEINQDVNIFILHKDIRTYGFAEDFYRKAREMGIHFLRYREEEKPVVEQVEGRIQVIFKDFILRRKIKINPDQLILSAGIVAGETEDLVSMLKVPLTSERFFLEAHVKLRPVDTQSDGIFICGMAHSPKRIDESISQALSASARACRLLSRDYIEVGGVVATVDPDRCAVCLTCVRTCPYGAPRIGEDGYAIIDPAECRGCGACAAECPGKAISLNHFTDSQLVAKIDALLLKEMGGAN